MQRPEILDTAKAYVTRDRQAEHGKPERNFQTIADLWTTYLVASGKINPNLIEAWGRNLAIEPHDVAAMMILLKVARIASTATNIDNWIDIAGYAACGGELATAQGEEERP